MTLWQGGVFAPLHTGKKSSRPWARISFAIPLIGPLSLRVVEHEPFRSHAFSVSVSQAHTHIVFTECWAFCNVWVLGFELFGSTRPARCFMENNVPEVLFEIRHHASRPYTPNYPPQQVSVSFVFFLVLFLSFFFNWIDKVFNSIVLLFLCFHQFSI